MGAAVMMERIAEASPRFKARMAGALNFFSLCLAPDFLDSELSVFMRRLRVQGVAGELGRA